MQTFNESKAFQQMLSTDVKTRDNSMDKNYLEDITEYMQIIIRRLAEIAINKCTNNNMSLNASKLLDDMSPEEKIYKFSSFIKEPIPKNNHKSLLSILLKEVDK